MRGRPNGTDVRREPDPRLLAEGLRAPGIDTRQWVDYGTVASIDDRQVPNFTDPNAIVVAPEGVDVDVVFGTSETPVTCRYGTQCGIGVILTPIRPGDLVLVAVPGGELGNVPVILQVIPGPHTPLPLDPSDRKPIFRNDRVSITARGVPIEIRTTGGARVKLDEDDVLLDNPRGASAELNGDGQAVTTATKIVEQSDDVRLTDAAATEQLVLGTTYRAAEQSMDTTLTTALTTLVAAFSTWAAGEAPTFSAAFPGTGILLTAIGTYAVAALAAVEGFEGGSAGYLSQKARTT